MLAKNWGRGLLFVAGSIVGGLALAFVIVALRPEIVRRSGLAASPQTTSSLPVQSGRVTYADAVRRAAPAVVNIYTARVVTERVAPSSLDELFREAWPRYRQRIENSLGSGVIVDGEGHIVTNHHVIANADAIRVQLADERVADAEIVGRDPDTDLAVLRIGIVSATTRSLGVATFEDFIQTDAAINVGNSGGALIDTSGALVGINTAVIAKTLGVEGIGFAIPVDLVRGVLADIIAHGHVIRGWIGIEPRDVPEYQRQQLGLPATGVLIANLYVGSPAQRAGLQPGDVLVDIDGVAVRSAQEAIARVAAHRKPGETIKLRVIRSGKSMELQTQIVEQPRGR